MEGINKKRLALLLAVILLLAGLLTAGVLSGARLEKTREDESLVRVHIHEIMASNSMYPVSGRLCDWVELYNPTGVPFDLSGFGLSDDTQNVKYFFPAGTVLGAGQYLTVPCARDTEDCADFGLSSQGGEMVTLFNRDSVAVESVTTVPVLRGQSQSRQSDGSWLVEDYATPGYENSRSGYESWLAARGTDGISVEITELMASGRITLRDADGDYPDWVELTNTGSAPADLTGYFLSDEEEDLMKWALPPLTLAPGQRTVVFCSGKNRVGAELHTSFALSSDGGTVYLTSPLGLPAGSFSYEALEPDQAVTPQGTTWLATPGYENSEAGREAFLRTEDRPGELLIYEAAVSNVNQLQQADGSYYDWIELKNASEHPIELGDYLLSTDPGGEKSFALPEKTLRPGEYCVILCTGRDTLLSTWYPTLPLSLSSGGERLYLYNKEGELSDRVFLRDIPYGGTMGRMEGESGFFLFSQPTPGRANGGGFRYQSAAPRPLTAPGVYDGVSRLRVEMESEGTVYYTLNGTLPTEANLKYTSPFVLEDTTVIRAVSVEEGKAPSDVVTMSFIINEEHTLPVVSLVAEKDAFFKEVYKNSQDRYAQCDAHVSFFDGDGGFDTDCSVKLHGLTSREVREKKSIKLDFKDRFGGDIHYDVFGTGEITDFGSLILRTGSIDYLSILRDEVAAMVAEKVSDTVLALDTRYCVLYINGDYWGIYAIREDYSRRYAADHTGSSPDSVTIVKAPVLAPLPGAEELYELFRDMEQYGLPDEAAYEEAAALFDMEALADWMVLEAYFNNNDVAGNIRYIKGDNTGGKWRIAFFDLDLGLANGNSDWYLVFDEFNQIGKITTELCRQPAFRSLLLERMELLLRNGLNHETVREAIRFCAGTIDPEVKRDAGRWFDDYSRWDSNVALMEGFFTPERTDKCIQQLGRYIHLSPEEIQALEHAAEEGLS